MKLRWFAAGVFGLYFLAGLAASPRALPTPSVRAISPLGKLASVRPGEDFFAQYETAPVIHAAWGESEALQLLVTAPDTWMSRLKASAGEFRHESGDVWEPGTVRTWHVGFVSTKEPYYGALHVGPWADPLLLEEETDVPSGQTRAIWVEVSVPLDSEAGRYSGEIVLEAEGWRKAVPLEVMVWGFDLPASPTLASSFLLYPRYVYQYHGLEKGRSAADAMIRRYQESMLAHRIMPTFVAFHLNRTRPQLDIGDDGQLRHADFSAFDEQIEWAMSRGQTVFGLEGPRRVNAWSEAWYRTVSDHLREKGWLDSFYTYLYDETYENVAAATAMVHAGAPDLKNLITRLPAEGFPDVDWWCPRLGDANMRALELDAWLESRDMSRDQLWVYTAGNAGSDVPALHLDVPGIEARVTPLAVWKDGYGGLLFWCVNYWTVDPWIDPMVYPRQNGNGSLYYPSPVGPVESVRLKLLRDGFDDVDYAQMLAESSVPLAGRILKALPLRSAVDWERDPLALTSWRLAAGYFLAGDEKLAASWVQKLESRRESEESRGLAVTNLDKPDKGWHGARDHEIAVQPDGRRVLRFTLDGKKPKLWRLPSPRDWRAHRELLMEIRFVEGDPVRLHLKLGSGLIKRQSWSWEIHMGPGARRRVRIPIPHERVSTDSLSELALFLWEPDSARRFEITGIWLK